MLLDELFDAARAGEPRAEDRLFRRLRRELLQFFRKRVPEAEVEDLVHRTLLILAQESERFESRGPGTYRSYVFTTAYNRLRTHLRTDARHRRDRETPGEWAPEPEPTSEATLWTQRGRLLREAMDVLKTSFREAVESHFRGEDPRTFAATKGVKTATIRTRVSRGIAALIKEIEARRQTRRETTPVPS